MLAARRARRPSDDTRVVSLHKNTNAKCSSIPTTSGKKSAPVSLSIGCTSAPSVRHWRPLSQKNQTGAPGRGELWPFLVSRFLMKCCKCLVGSRAKPGGIHAYCYHWRRIGWRDARASLDQAWRGCDLGSTQSRRSETCGATKGARQSASRSRQRGRDRGDRDALVRGRGGDQEPGQPLR